jgi:hypothetical protein
MRSIIVEKERKLTLNTKPTLTKSSEFSPNQLGK